MKAKTSIPIIYTEIWYAELFLKKMKPFLLLMCIMSEKVLKGLMKRFKKDNESYDR